MTTTDAENKRLVAKLAVQAMEHMDYGMNALTNATDQQKRDRKNADWTDPHGQTTWLVDWMKVAGG